MRLIDADALLKNRFNMYTGFQGTVPVVAVRDVDNAPTIDHDSFRPKGRWVNNADEYPRCDKCGYMPMFDPVIDDIFYSPYCPQCGADMRGDDEHG